MTSRKTVYAWIVVILVALIVGFAVALRPYPPTLIPVNEIIADLPLRQPKAVPNEVSLSGDAYRDAAKILDAMHATVCDVHSFRVRQTRLFADQEPRRSVIAGQQPNLFVLRYEAWAGALAFVSDGTSFRVSNEQDIEATGAAITNTYLQGDSPNDLSAILRAARQISVKPGTHALPDVELMALLPFAESASEVLGALGWSSVRLAGVDELGAGSAFHLVCEGYSCSTVSPPAITQSVKPAENINLTEPEENKLHLWVSQEPQSLLLKCKYGSFEMNYSDWLLDPQLPAGTFRLPPTLGYKKRSFEFSYQEAIVGKTAPPLRLRLLNGEETNLDRYRGKVVVLDFWATWCRPCLKELPVVAGVVDSFGDDVELIAVTSETDKEAIQDAISRIGSQIRVGIDLDNSSASFQVVSIPHIIVVDKDGRITASHVGFSEGLENILTGELRELVNDGSLQPN